MNHQLLQGACMLEPSLCELAVTACLETRDALSLFELEAICNLADACILFDDVLYLDTHQPSLRTANLPLSIERRTRHHLNVDLGWDFVDCKHHITEFPGSDAVDRLRALRPREDFIRESLSDRVTRVKRVPHPILGELDWSTFLYADKVNSAASALGATVLHGRKLATVTVSAMGACHPGLTTNFVTEYGLAVQKRHAAARRRLDGPVFHYAPFLLAVALNQVEQRNPRQLLKSIEQIRNHVTKKYRQLCLELSEARASEYDTITLKIEQLLEGLAQRDERIPHALGPMSQTVIALAKPFAGLAKLGKALVGDLPALTDAATLIGETMGELKNPRIERWKDHRVYAALSFFNRLHDARIDAPELAKRLRRVFGVLEFDLEELQAYLQGCSPQEIISRRSRRR